MHDRSTDHATRVGIVKRHLAGETLPDIAQQLQLNFYTVRKWWRTYNREGWKGLVPKPAGPPPHWPPE